MENQKKDGRSRLSRLIEDAMEERFNEEYRREHGKDPQKMDPEMYKRFKEYADNRREEEKKKGGKTIK